MGTGAQGAEGATRAQGAPRPAAPTTDTTTDTASETTDAADATDALPGAAAGRVSMSFLFSDIVGSTRKWEEFPRQMVAALERHDRLLDDVVAAHGGRIFHRAGDGMIASFPAAADAVSAAAECQRRITAADWGDVGELAVRVGVHHGEVVLRDGEPFGWALNYGARLSDSGHGGQVLLSGAVLDAVDGELPAPYSARLIGTIRLRDIARPATVFQLEGPGLTPGALALRHAGRPARLPTSPGALIGRDSEIAAIEASLRRHRLVTVLGPPGVGKSRIAVEAVNRLIDTADPAEAASTSQGSPRSPGGQVRQAVACDLTGIQGEGVVGSVVTALGVSTRAGRTAEQSLVEWIADQALVLVLDHCDAGHDRVADIAREVVGAAPAVTVVCTSSRPLGVAGECLHRVDPLAIDDAVELFVDRAVAPAGAVVDGPDLRRVCEQLDRLPLAIEVAAAQVPLFSVGELATILASPDANPAGGGGSTVRWRPDADAIALGFDVLSPELQEMLIAATSFAGGFDREGFTAVCAPGAAAPDAAAALAELVNRSLISADPTAGGGRFRILNGARDTLAARAEPAARQRAGERFVDWEIEFARRAAAGLRGPDEGVWNRRVAGEWDNLRAAFTRSLAAGDVRRCAAICTELWDYGFMRFTTEYFRWGHRLIEQVGEPHDDGADGSVLAPVYGTAALGAWFRDDREATLRWAGRALELERAGGLAFDLPARLALINAAVYSGAAAPPPDVYGETVTYQRQREERYFHVNLDVQNSIMATWLGQTEAATRRGLRAVRVARESGNPSSLAFGLWALGSSLEAGDPLHAESLLGQALGVARDVENRWVTALVQMSLASLRRRTAGPIDAAPLLIDLLEALSRAGHRSHLWHALRLSGLVLGELGDHELAVQLLTWVAAAQLAMPALPVDERAIGVLLATIGAQRGDGWIDRVVLITGTWTPDTASGLARAALERRLADVA